MKVIPSRAASAVRLLVSCFSIMSCFSICFAQTQTLLLCVANDTPECSSHNPQPGLSPAYLNCSVWPQINQLSQDPAIGLGKLYCGANNLYSATTVVHTGGQSCTVEMADVKCREGAARSAQLCIGDSCPGGLVDYPCQFAWNHPTDTDTQAASTYCASQNLGVLSYFRIRSESGGACGRIYDNVSCGSYNNVGNVYPHYMVMTILYAPPGCGTATQPCSSNNSVEYSNQSSAGSELTISHEQDQTYSFEASLGPKVFQGQYSFEKEKSTTDSHDQSLTKTSQSTLTLDGGPDGIDHENDTFYFLLNPAISIQALGNTLTWNLDVRPLNSSYHAGDPLYQTLTVRELKHPSTIWASKKQVFTDAQVRLTDPHTDPNSDIPKILALDPFANGLRYQMNGKFLWPDDPYYHGRYRSTTIGSIPYSGSPGSPCVTGQGNLTNSFSNSTTQESKVTYTEKAEASSGIDDVYSVTVGGEIALTNSSTLETSTGGTQSATLQLSCPTQPLDYANVDVFWDLVYGTFLFVPGENRGGNHINPNNTAVTEEIYRGTIASSCGRITPGLPVDLEMNGAVFHTFTDQHGEYSFLPVS